MNVLSSADLTEEEKKDSEKLLFRSKSSSNVENNETKDNAALEEDKQKTSYFGENITKSRETGFGILSLCTFDFITCEFWKGLRSKIEIKDVPDIPEKIFAEKNMERFDRIQKKVFKNGGNKKEKHFLLKLYICLLYSSIFEYIYSIFFSIISSILYVSLTPIMRLVSNQFKPYLSSEIQQAIDFAKIVLPSDFPNPPSQSDYSSMYRSGGTFDGLLYVFLLSGVQLLRFLTQEHSRLFAIKGNTIIETILMSNLFRKMTRVSLTLTPSLSTGNIMNMISVDSLKLAILFEWTTSLLVPFIIVAPATSYLLCDLLGVSAIGGIASSFIIIPLIIIMYYIVSLLKKSILKLKDLRISLISEFVSSFVAVKIFCWEEIIIKKITDVRSKESKLLKISKIIRSFSYSLFVLIPVIMSLSSLSLFSILQPKNFYDPIIIFTAISYFDSLKNPFLWLPNFFISIIESNAAMKRISDFLQTEEVPILEKKTNPTSEVSLSFKECEFSWNILEKNEEKTKKKDDKMKISLLKKNNQNNDILNNNDEKQNFLLKIGDLEIKKNSLNIIIGKVGSGKTSLLLSIMNEMNKIKGNLEVFGKACYCSQIPFLVNSSIKDNIMFGMSKAKDKNSEVLQQTRLEKAIKDCELYNDLDEMKYGIETTLGEAGVTISGGQKARVALARTAYLSEKFEIVLLDDSLSACDPIVSQRIFTNLIKNRKKNSFFEEKTVIFATHALSFCSDESVNSIILIDNGEIIEHGSFSDLMNKKSHFYDLFSEFSLKNEESKKETKKDENFEEESSKNEEKNIQIRKIEKKSEKNDKNDKNLMSKEEKGMSEDSRSVFSCLKSLLVYFKSANKISLIVLVLVYISLILFSSLNLIFLSFWSSSKFSAEYGTFFNSSFCNFENNSIKFENISNNFYKIYEIYENDSVKCFKYIIDCSIWSEDYVNSTVPIYQSFLASLSLSSLSLLVIFFCIGVIIILMQLFKEIFLQMICLNISNSFHDKSVIRMSNATTRWHQTTPSGRITGRFSVDVSVMDDDLGQFFQLMLDSLVSSLSSLVSSGLASYGISVLLSLVLIPFYFIIWNIYRPCGVALRRIFTTLKSPLFAHISECLNDLSSIRGIVEYDDSLSIKSSSVSGIHMRNLSLYTRCYYCSRMAYRWLQIRLDILGVFLVFFSALFCLIFSNFDILSVASASLILSVSIQVCSHLELLVRSSTTVESLTSNIDKLYSFSTQIPQEPSNNNNLKVNDLKVSKSVGASLKFEDYCLKYSENGNDILKNINLNISGGLKVGIVGKTGSGKSSLTNGMLRLVEDNLTKGKILIDEVNIKEMDLKNLRKSISMIPQNPSLLSGSLRNNLDPNNENNDNDLRQALIKANFDVEKYSSLDMDVGQLGKNLSIGERQQVCLARAILRANNKEGEVYARILCLDEATANVDLVTDKHIQDSIRNNFSNQTILTIAHRVSTIIDYDLIVVMRDGLILELGSPFDLISKNPSSHFKNLILSSPDPQFLLNQITKNKK